MYTLQLLGAKKSIKAQLRKEKYGKFIELSKVIGEYFLLLFCFLGFCVMLADLAVNFS